ncbi:MAG: GspH/FimT family pseudopilin [Bermanella sp.]|jgi:prepilin-type N-terminal cleavage/methylation domain
MKNSNIKHQQGMTLIELMVSLVVLAIMASVAVPTMKGLFERKNIVETGKYFERSVRLARTEAINRGAIVRIQPTSGSGDWSQGWFLEYTKADASNEVIRTFPAPSGNPSFVSAEFNGSLLLQIRPSGQAVSRGEFTLSYPTNCTVGTISYELLLSGILLKETTPCS